MKKTLIKTPPDENLEKAMNVKPMLMMKQTRNVQKN